MRVWDRQGSVLLESGPEDHWDLAGSGVVGTQTEGQ